VPIDKLKDISPEFYKMVNDKHYKIINFEQLSNKSWDDAF